MATSAKRREPPRYQGLTFDSLRTAITAIYWLREDTPADDVTWLENRRFVVPMQHNWENPIKAGDRDTYIQFWIDRDDRLTRDTYRGGLEYVSKLADVTLRFIGVQGEQWAKAFHHLAERNVVHDILEVFCNGGMLQYVRPIVPVNVDYFKIGNTAIAFETGFSLQYEEYMDLSHLNEPLMYVSFPAGKITREEDLAVEGNE